MVDIEVKTALCESVFNMVDDLLLNADFVVADVFTHKLPEFVLPLLLHLQLLRIELGCRHARHRRTKVRHHPAIFVRVIALLHVFHRRHRVRVHQPSIDV